MPFATQIFYGDVQLGDFTLNHLQMDEILEPESYQPLPRIQFEKVLSQPRADYRRHLKLFGLSDFKLIQLSKDNTYQDDEYFLYARNLRALQRRPSYSFRRNLEYASPN